MFLIENALSRGTQDCLEITLRTKFHGFAGSSLLSCKKKAVHTSITTAIVMCLTQIESSKSIGEAVQLESLHDD